MPSSVNLRQQICPPGGAEEGTAVISRRGGQPADVGSVRIHGVEIQKGRRVPVPGLHLLRSQTALIGQPIRSEHDPSAVGRPGGLGVISQLVGEVPEGLRSQRESVDFIFGIEVPRVPAGPARGPALEFLPLLAAGFGIMVGRSEEDLTARRMNPAAGGLAMAGREPAHLSPDQVHQVDLEERVFLLALALEDQQGAVRAEISFPGTPAFESELPGLGKQRLSLDRRRFWLRRRGSAESMAGGDERQDGCPDPDGQHGGRCSRTRRARSVSHRVKISAPAKRRHGIRGAQTPRPPVVGRG